MSSASPVLFLSSSRKPLGKPLRIIHVLAPAPFGGLESVVQSLAIEQKEQGHEIVVAALMETGAAEPVMLERLRSANIDVVVVAAPSRSYLTQRRAILELCESRDAQVLHTHGYLPDVISASLGRRARFVRVCTVHGFVRGSYRNRVYEWMQRKSFSRFDAVVAVSGHMSSELRAASARNRIVTLPNAWSPVRPFLSREEARNTLGLSPAKFNIGWIGRISREKGPDVMIDALPHLGIFPWHLTVVGDGKERKAVEERAHNLGLGDRVSFRGQVTDASTLLRGFDIIAMSSRTEGTPIVLLEAMRAEVPIVATNVGGIPDVLSEREGIVVPPDNPPALASAILQVHSARLDASARAQRAKLRVQKDFSTARWAASYDAIYRSSARIES
jgi:glycosyltransferase involved in cell wall biosynthesis